MLHLVTDTDREIHFIEDLNIDCFFCTCILTKKLNDLAIVCNKSPNVNLLELI